MCGVKKQVLSRTPHERLAPRSQGSRAPGLPGDRKQNGQSKASLDLQGLYYKEKGSVLAPHGEEVATHGMFQTQLEDCFGQYGICFRHRHRIGVGLSGSATGEDRKGLWL